MEEEEQQTIGEGEGEGTGEAAPAPVPTLEGLQAELAATRKRLEDLSNENKGLTRRIIKQSTTPPWANDLKAEVAALGHYQRTLASLTLEDPEEDLRLRSKRERFEETIKQQPPTAPPSQAGQRTMSVDQIAADRGMRAYAKAKGLDVNKLPKDIEKDLEQVGQLFWDGDTEGSEERFMALVDGYLTTQQQQAEEARKADVARRKQAAQNMVGSGLQPSGSGTPNLETLLNKPTHKMEPGELKQYRQELKAAIAASTRGG